MSRSSMFAATLPPAPKVPYYAPYHRPAVATDHAHGYRVKGAALHALAHYDGGKNALSLGPHHNRLSHLERVERAKSHLTGIPVDLSRFEKWRRKVDMKIEILAAALYAEGYSVQDMEAKSPQLFGTRLNAMTIYACVRRAFGINYRRMGAKKRAEFAERARKILNGELPVPVAKYEGTPANPRGKQLPTNSRHALKRLVA